jgi:predicted Zn-dependent peptidase
MQEQLRLVQEGRISELEIKQTKATLANQYRELLDSARLLIDFTYNGMLSGRRRSLGELLQQLEEVDMDDLTRAASRIQIDTIYLLRDNKGGA